MIFVFNHEAALTQDDEASAEATAQRASKKYWMKLLKMKKLSC